MQCPFCKEVNTKVVDKRNNDDLGIVRRRRECIDCKKRFTTYEKIDMTDLTVIKRGGRREAFNSEKLKSGILRACEKRPINIHQIESLIEGIEDTIRKMSVREIKTDKVGQLVLNELKLLDKVACIRFASVYKSFQNISEFEEEIKDLLKAK